MLTVRDVVTSRLQRLRDKKRRLQDEVAVVQAEIDRLTAIKDGLTPPIETTLATLADAGVIQAAD